MLCGVTEKWNALLKSGDGKGDKASAGIGCQSSGTPEFQMTDDESSFHF